MLGVAVMMPSVEEVNHGEQDFLPLRQTETSHAHPVVVSEFRQLPSGESGKDLEAVMLLARHFVRLFRSPQIGQQSERVSAAFGQDQDVDLMLQGKPGRDGLPVRMPAPEVPEEAGQLARRQLVHSACCILGYPGSRD
jgi:hypothetical protein